VHRAKLRKRRRGCLTQAGKALEKPGVNAVHKQEVRRVAQELARRANDSEEKKEVLALVADAQSFLSAERAAEFRAAIDAAYKKMAEGRHPLAGLDVKGVCDACAGGHSAHHPLCALRKIRAKREEQTLKEAVERALTTVWRARQLAQARHTRA
jgi:excinuclease UvrABC nuclease subunit